MITVPDYVTTQQRIDIRNQKDIQLWCRRFNCTKEQLLYCVMKVGNSPQSVGDFWHMNKDRLETYFQLIWEEIKMN